MALIESIGDPTLTVGLSFAAIYAKIESAEWSDVLRWSQKVIDLADGDPSKGNFIFGSPLALAFTTRAMPGIAWVVPDGATTCGTAWPWPAAPTPCPTPRSSPTSTSAGIPDGVLRPDDSAVREIEDALRIAERSGDDLALAFARMTLGVALVHRQRMRSVTADRSSWPRSATCSCAGDTTWAIYRSSNVYLARERARRGDRDDAISLMRAAVDHLFREGQLLAWGIPATGVLVETLLDRGADGDVAEAEAAIERLAAAPADDGLVVVTSGCCGRKKKNRKKKKGRGGGSGAGQGGCWFTPSASLSPAEASPADRQASPAWASRR